MQETFEICFHSSNLTRAIDADQALGYLELNEKINANKRARALMRPYHFTRGFINADKVTMGGSWLEPVAAHCCSCRS